MSPELDRLLSRLAPATPENLVLRLQFGLTCCERVQHLLEHPEVLACVQSFRMLMQGQQALDGHLPLGARATELANRHPGSRSLDGVGHAAVSATYACAAAMSGKPRQAAEYTAYAMVYGHGGYGATRDPESFAPEDQWLAQRLESLLGQVGAAGLPR